MSGGTASLTGDVSPNSFPSESGKVNWEWRYAAFSDEVD